MRVLGGTGTSLPFATIGTRKFSHTGAFGPLGQSLVKNLSGDIEYMSHSFGSLSAERRESSFSSNDRADLHNEEEG